MIWIDSAILDITERLCRRFQLWTGKTNVWLATQLTNLSIVVYFVWIASYYQHIPLVPRIAVGLFCAGVLYVLSQTVFQVPIETSENNAFRRVAKGLRNPRRVRDAQLRISFLTLSILLLYPFLLVSIKLRLPLVLLSYPLVVLTTIVLYVLACDPLPPCAGRVPAWIRTLVALRPSAAESTGADTSRAIQAVSARGPCLSESLRAGCRICIAGGRAVPKSLCRNS